MDHNLPPNVRQIIDLLGSPDSDLRIFAAAKLATLDCRDDKVRLALETATRDDPDLFVREEARSTLGQLGFPIPEHTDKFHRERKNISTPETPLSGLTEYNRIKPGNDEDHADQSEQVLVIESYMDEMKNIMWGFVFIVFACVFLLFNVSQKSEIGAVFYLFASVYIWLIAVGVYFIIALPGIYTFDRMTSELSVQHRTLLFEWKSHYPLSEIKAVRLITSINKDTGKSSYSLSLEIPNGPLFGTITISKSEIKYLIEANAQRAASFLGFSLERETKEVYSPPEKYN